MDDDLSHIELAAAGDREVVAARQAIDRGLVGAGNTYESIRSAATDSVQPTLYRCPSVENERVRRRLGEVHKPDISPRPSGNDRQVRITARGQ